MYMPHMSGVYTEAYAGGGSGADGAGGRGGAEGGCDDHQTSK